eukprot:scaffold496287_cov18-Prasinocladus_malaysianus.AAC.1
MLLIVPEVFGGTQSSIPIIIFIIYLPVSLKALSKRYKHDFNQSVLPQSGSGMVLQRAKLDKR